MLTFIALCFLLVSNPYVEAQTKPIQSTSETAIQNPTTDLKSTENTKNTEPKKETKEQVSPVVQSKALGRKLKRILAEISVIHGQISLGTITILLFTDKAPRTVDNFVDLAEGRKEFTEYREGTTKGKKVVRPFYDGLTFHRISPGYVIQGGCPFGSGRGGPGYTIQDEVNSELHHDSPGIVSMANTGQKDSAGSQFFITLKETPKLDGSYSVFGKVVKGMEVVNKIAKVKRDPTTERPLEPVVMKSVKIIREYLK
ncbi:MAG: peptidylprolyl isomerase [Bdellovibrionales bacterium]|nr:peptidylprolyl isomerase [Bdellovibrionales bacterium]